MHDKSLIGESLPVKKAVKSAVCTETGIMFHFRNFMTGQVTAMHLDVHADDYLSWAVTDLSIQEAMSELSPGIRELFITGMNEEDWDRLGSDN